MNRITRTLFYAQSWEYFLAKITTYNWREKSKKYNSWFLKSVLHFLVEEEAGDEEHDEQSDV